MAKEKLTKEQVIKAIKDNDGFIYLAAKQLNVALRTVFNYMERYPAIREAIEQKKEEFHDTVEKHIKKHIEDGNIAMTIFYAKTKMKHRGYYELKGDFDFDSQNKISDILEQISKIKLKDEEIEAVIKSIRSAGSN